MLADECRQHGREFADAGMDACGFRAAFPRQDPGVSAGHW